MCLTFSLTVLFWTASPCHDQVGSWGEAACIRTTFLTMPKTLPPSAFCLANDSEAEEAKVRKSGMSHLDPSRHAPRLLTYPIPCRSPGMLSPLARFSLSSVRSSPATRQTRTFRISPV